jgi:DHA1 family bicyclomycin/chloramphenicol resistance-like MFS transporter
MRLKPGTRGMTVLLALMTALGPLSTDIYLASMPHIGAALGASNGSVQLTMSVYIVGFAFGQVLHGPLSDKYGRRPVSLAGLALYLAATAACVASTSIEALIMARVAQALGAAASIILSRAIVRDLYEGAQAGRQLATMSAIAGFTPICAPMLGGVLQTFFDWRASFMAMGLLGAALTMALFAWLPETNRHRQVGPLSIRAILASFGVVLKNPAYRSYLGIQAFSYNGLFAFLCGSSYVLQEIYGFSAMQFGLLFAVCSMSFVSGALLGGRMVARRGLEGMIRLGASCLLIGGFGQLLAVLAFPASAVALIGPQMIYFLGVGFLLPNTQAAAMTPFPERAGAASSLIGFAQMTSAALVSWIMAASLGGTALPMVVVMALAGVGSFAVFHLTKRHRKPQAG